MSIDWLKDGSGSMLANNYEISISNLKTSLKAILSHDRLIAWIIDNYIIVEDYTILINYNIFFLKNILNFEITPSPEFTSVLRKSVCHTGWHFTIAKDEYAENQSVFLLKLSKGN